jgi:hypothetical protein
MAVTALADHCFAGRLDAAGRFVTLPPGDGFFGVIA